MSAGERTRKSQSHEPEEEHSTTTQGQRTLCGTFGAKLTTEVSFVGGSLSEGRHFWAWTTTGALSAAEAAALCPSLFTSTCIPCSAHQPVFLGRPAERTCRAIDSTKISGAHDIRPIPSEATQGPTADIRHSEHCGLLLSALGGERFRGGTCFRSFQKPGEPWAPGSGTSRSSLRRNSINGPRKSHGVALGAGKGGQE